MSKRSRIEFDDFTECWRVYCCECGEYCGMEGEKPEHYAYACEKCEEDEEECDLT